VWEGHREEACQNWPLKEEHMELCVYRRVTESWDSQGTCTYMEQKVLRKAEVGWAGQWAGLLLGCRQRPNSVKASSRRPWFHRNDR
jgi:hypothetical protein